MDFRMIYFACSNVSINIVAESFEPDMACESLTR